MASTSTTPKTNTSPRTSKHTMVVLASVALVAFFQLSAAPEQSRKPELDALKSLVVKQHEDLMTLLNGTPPSAEENDHSRRYLGTSFIAAFNHKNDTHMKTGQRKEDYKAIQSWYESVSAFSDINGVVFNSMFSADSVSKYSTDHIRFHSIDVTSPTYLYVANQSLNNQRFHLIEEYLDERFAAEKAGIAEPDPNLEYLLLTDAQDVTFLRNPFQYMIEMDALTEGQHHLFVGSEFEPWKEGLTWQRGIWRKCLGKDFQQHRLVNAGIIGGHKSIIIPLIKEMNIRMTNATHTVCDQVVLQQITMEWYEEKVIMGYPFHSRFKKEQRTKDDTLAFIRHK